MNINIKELKENKDLIKIKKGKETIYIVINKNGTVSACSTLEGTIAGGLNLYDLENLK